MIAGPSSWGFEPGDTLDDGRSAVRLLGGGDRYEAWLGWDDHLAAPVVFKLLRPDQSDGIRPREAIAREAATLASLAHPGIVRCFDARVDGPRPYLVLEFLDGPRLSTLVRRYGPLSHEQVVPLALEIGSALTYLHNVGLVHLDVKPQNVIMGAPPRLIDLSIARPLAELASLRGPLGTDAYMAPEQCLRGRPLAGRLPDGCLGARSLALRGGQRIPPVPQARARGALPSADRISASLPPPGAHSHPRGARRVPPA